MEPGPETSSHRPSRSLAALLKPRPDDAKTAACAKTQTPTSEACMGSGNDRRADRPCCSLVAGTISSLELWSQQPCWPKPRSSKGSLRVAI